MSDLVTWFRAQLDEDERVAREGQADGISQWLTEGHNVINANGWRIASSADPAEREAAEHIARWDPARVLAEVRAKRRILDECLAVWADEGGTQIGDLPETVVRLLAQLYAGRDGWREEWRP